MRQPGQAIFSMTWHFELYSNESIQCLRQQTKLKDEFHQFLWGAWVNNYFLFLPAPNFDKINLPQLSQSGRNRRRYNCMVD